MLEGLEIPEEMEKNDASIVVQKYFRGFVARETVSKLREEELHFLGMKR